MNFGLLLHIPGVYSWRSSVAGPLGVRGAVRRRLNPAPLSIEIDVLYSINSMSFDASVRNSLGLRESGLFNRLRWFSSEARRQTHSTFSASRFDSLSAAEFSKLQLHSQLHLQQDRSRSAPHLEAFASGSPANSVVTACELGAFRA